MRSRGRHIIARSRGGRRYRSLADWAGASLPGGGALDSDLETAGDVVHSHPVQEFPYACALYLAGRERHTAYPESTEGMTLQRQNG